MGANPTGLDNEGPRYIHFFVHNVYANFFKDSLDYFSKHIYPRFEYTVVGTYTKAVEYLQKKCQYGRETDMPMKPALILNPTGDFELADANAGGRQLWRFSNQLPGYVKYIFDPIYRDANVQMHAGFTRMQGDIELLMLLGSFYEYCDVKMMLLQIFGGMDKWIYPQFFQSFIVLPEEVVNFRYTNPYTHLNYKIDWTSTDAYSKLVSTIGQTKLVYPCNIKPIYKLTNFGDASQRYGGTDQLPDWRLSATVHYEVEIPTYIVIQSDYLAETMNVNLNINVASESAYSAYDFTTDSFKHTITREIDWGLDETSNSTFVVDATSTETFNAEYEYNSRFFHIVSQSEIDSTSDINITLPFQVTDLNEISLNSKYGPLTYGDHYMINGDGYNIEIFKDNVELEAGMIIDIYKYTRIV